MRPETIRTCLSMCCLIEPHAGDVTGDIGKVTQGQLHGLLLCPCAERLLHLFLLKRREVGIAVHVADREPGAVGVCGASAPAKGAVATAAANGTATTASTTCEVATAVACEVATAVAPSAAGRPSQVFHELVQKAGLHCVRGREAGMQRI